MDWLKSTFKSKNNTDSETIDQEDSKSSTVNEEAETQSDDHYQGNDGPYNEYDDSLVDDAKSVISQISYRTNKSNATNATSKYSNKLNPPVMNNSQNKEKSLENGSVKINGSQKSILRRDPVTVTPSYKAKNDLTSVIATSNKPEVIELNERYNRTRRYDTAGKYRIGPTFITKSRLAYLDAHKPAKLSVVPDPLFKSLEFGLLTYLWTFTDQHDKQEIDLAFLQSLIDSGVNINCADEHGQTALHAIVRDWHPDVALFAVRNNADVNAQDKMGRSPLHLAAAINCVEIAKILLLNGGKI